MSEDKSTLKQAAKPPTPQCLEGNMMENWKTFKKRWSNYALLINLAKEKR